MRISDSKGKPVKLDGSPPVVRVLNTVFKKSTGAIPDVVVDKASAEKVAPHMFLVKFQLRITDPIAK